MILIFDFERLFIHSFGLKLYYYLLYVLMYSFSAFCFKSGTSVLVISVVFLGHPPLAEFLHFGFPFFFFL